MPGLALVDTKTSALPESLDRPWHNELWRARGDPESEVVPVSFLPRLCANSFDFRFDAAMPSRKVEA